MSLVSRPPTPHGSGKREPVSAWGGSAAPHRSVTNTSCRGRRLLSQCLAFTLVLASSSAVVAQTERPRADDRSAPPGRAAGPDRSPRGERPPVRGVESRLPRRDQATVPPIVPDRNRKLNPGDVIEILVDNGPEYSGKFRIFLDGSFDYLIGSTRVAVVAKERTTAQVEAELTGKLKTQLRRPSVRVTLVEIYEPPKPEVAEPPVPRITVLGAVERKGEVELPKPKPLRTVLAEAGLTNDANLGEVRVQQRSGETLVYDFRRHSQDGTILRNGEVVQDLVLQGGEEILIPKQAAPPKPEVVRVNVLGRVGNQGELEVAPGTNLIEVLKRAQAQVLGSDLTRVEVTNGSSPARIVNVQSYAEGNLAANYIVRSGDVIIVREMPVKVRVVGEVNKPGEYYIRDTTTVSQAYNDAGAKNPNGNEKEVRIFRTGADGKSGETRLDLNRIAQRKAEDVVLRNGDVIFVPARQSKRGVMYYLNALSTPLLLFRGF